MPRIRLVLCEISMCCLSLLLVTPLSAQDAAAGKQIFAQCSVCHSTDGTNGVGPSLRGIVGRKAGTFARPELSLTSRRRHMQSPRLLKSGKPGFIRFFASVAREREFA